MAAISSAVVKQHAQTRPNRDLIYCLRLLSFAIPLFALARYGYFHSVFAADALCQASRDGESSIIRSLLSQGVNPDTIGGEGAETPLTSAIAAAEYDSAEVLIAHGASPNGLNKYGQTPLDTLIVRLHTHGMDPVTANQMFDLLVQHGGHTRKTLTREVYKLPGSRRDQAAIVSY